MGELALNMVLAGDLLRPVYPQALADSAASRWAVDASASLQYAHRAITQRGDVLTALANASRGIIEAAHSQLARHKTWVLNEKGIADAAELSAASESLLSVTSHTELRDAIERAVDLIDA